MKSWIPTLSVGFASFIFVTSEFIPVGLLSEIAHGFFLTDAQTGLMMTIYAWVVAIMSLPLTAYSAKFNRRNLLLTLIAVFVGAHVLSTVAWSFGSLIVSRLLVALTHAVFWAIAVPLGIRLAPPGGRERGMAIVTTGATMGSILGIPFGTYLGQAFGWRVSFAAIGLCAAIVGITLLKTLPSTPSQNSDDFGVIGRLFRRRNLVVAYLLTAVIMTGHYTAFTFISPYLQDVGGLKKELVATILLVFGCSGFFGTFIAPKFMTAHLKKSALVSLALVTVCLVLFRFAVTSLPATLVLVFVWGTSFLIFNLVLQNVILFLAPDAEDVAMAGYSGIYNIGIGGGALIGSLSSAHALWSIGFTGAGLVAVAFCICAYLMRAMFPVARATT